MVYVPKDKRHILDSLFAGWDETLIWSFLQGIMGNAWADSLQKPTSAQIITGDFCFFAGVPSIELVKHIPNSFTSEALLMVPQTQEWEACIEAVYASRAERFTRYAFKKQPDIFNRKLLHTYTERLPQGYTIQQIDNALFTASQTQAWSKDLCAQFSNYTEFKTLGLGYMILHNGEPVCGASSYTVYNGGIEIEIDTKSEYRRKGLALSCAAQLILTCLEQNLYPSWDAANTKSVALAQKLGYQLDKPYVTYSVPTVNNQ